MTTDKTIEEMNIAIAKFLGFTYYDHGIRPCVVDHLKNAIHAADLKYHEDWNQLIAVGKKIYDWLNEQQKQRPPHTATQGDLLEVDIHCAIKEYDIEKTHKAIYEFIQWYNTTTKQKD